MKPLSNRPNNQIVDTPENWDAASQGYAKKIAPFLMETFAEDLIERLDVNPLTEALEVAAGSGALTMALAMKVKSLLATDFSPNMIELARLKINNANLTNVSFELMDGQALELENHVMDRTACSFGLMLFPDRHKGFTELRRVLRPGGKAVISAWAGPDKFEAFALLMAAMQKAFPNLPKPAAPPPVFSLANLDAFKLEMEAAGFRNVNTEYVPKDLTVHNFNEMWEMLTTGAPPVKILFDRVGEEGKDRIHDALAEIVEKRFGGGPITITNTATIGVGSVR